MSFLEVQKHVLIGGAGLVIGFPTATDKFQLPVLQKACYLFLDFGLLLVVPVRKVTGFIVSEGSSMVF